MGYIFEGEYCGDFELNPATLLESKNKKDFTDVIEVWEPHTFIPEVMHLDCNQLYPDGTDLKLPSCDGEDPNTQSGYPQNPQDPEEEDCIDNEDCHRPCHDKCKKNEASGEDEFLSKYHPSDFMYLHY